jgi:hypothetical protein
MTLQVLIQSIVEFLQCVDTGGRNKIRLSTIKSRVTRFVHLEMRVQLLDNGRTIVRKQLVKNIVTMKGCGGEGG